MRGSVGLMKPAADTSTLRSNGSSLMWSHIVSLGMQFELFECHNVSISTQQQFAVAIIN